MKKILITGLLALWVLIWSGPAFAVDLDQLQRQMDLMADELESFKFKKGAGSEPDRVSVHGYGELHYNNSLDENGGNTEIDQHRFVIGVHAILADWIHFNAEIDFEHAAQDTAVKGLAFKPAPGSPAYDNVATDHRVVSHPKTVDGLNVRLLGMTIGPHERRMVARAEVGIPGEFLLYSTNGTMPTDRQ